MQPDTTIGQIHWYFYCWTHQKEGSILRVRQVDVLDGTPLLDIKPYVSQFDQRINVEIGWLKDKIKKPPE